MPGNRLGRGWREKVWPKGTCSSKTRPGHRAGKTRLARSSGYVKQQRRISSCGSRRSCTTSKPGNSARGLLLFEEGSRAGRGRGDVAALRGRTGEESPEPFRKAEARSVPSEAGA